MSIILNVINYFWKIGFNEDQANKYVKTYQDNYKITIDIELEKMDYGNEIKVLKENLIQFSQINFVVMESIDRFLGNAYDPQNIVLGESNDYHYSVKNSKNDFSIGVKCKIWEEEFDGEVSSFIANQKNLSLVFENNEDINHFCLYTSRLKAGLIEHKYAIFSRRDVPNSQQLIYTQGLFETNLKPYTVVFTENTPQYRNPKTEIITIGDFKIIDGTLIEYSGNDKEVIIPDGVTKLRNSIFWNFNFIEKIIIPDSVVSLGGDTFYFCRKLKSLKIPRNVEIMGDNPFGNCPELELENQSPNFILENGVLYNKEKTRLIYYSMKNKQTRFEVPDGLVSISKHSFYNCNILEEIIIPPSIKIIENNPFSNCDNLRIKNNSPHFIFKDGAVYNKIGTTLFYYELSRKETNLEILEGVKIIGRHSFFNCQNLYTLTIPESVEIIGYNPFTNCKNLSIINYSPFYDYEDGALYTKDRSEIVYCSIPEIKSEFIIPESVTKIGRSAFYGCENLEKVIISDNVKHVERSAFANCVNLKEVYLSKNVSHLQEWAFYNCVKLEKINLSDNVKYETNTFSKSQILIDSKLYDYQNSELQIEEEKQLEIRRGINDNFIYEGDNLDVLHYLENEYSRRIDVICIDPPYNTGMDTLNYNDYHFSEGPVTSPRNSNWIEFMRNRIMIANRLLSNGGVMFINIDEHEINNLTTLCYNIFQKNNVQVLIWPKTDPEFDTNRIEKEYHNVKMSHEYIILCYKNKASTKLSQIRNKEGNLVDLESIITGLGTTSSAKDELGEIFSDRLIFQTPKPMRLLKELIRASSTSDSIVLDFFAGSGTTGHAVMDLNKEDDGQRKFILVNNNENQICREITYPRIKKVIETQNYEEGVKYFILSKK